ncbi:chromate efflux transporter [Oceanospirillum sediminis]|uniref:Chromate efflux transporter n=1 Tax=Oceanospirillum sediminis TaxID=2760088 RepID=A0A839IS41_9GAMM|nr:chromate efflux transporter [Oceanospirillum sediminis]MBB1487257.1 chromate efflux transporter [Oceanospirillum sediminis]
MKQVLDIFWRFLLLGCVSFGGPAAHIGYFRAQFVEKLRWLDDTDYARLVALSQFLPGPGSSQVGFAIGVNRAGLKGGLSAFAGFTIPSFLLLTVLATLTLEHSSDSLSGIIHGLKLLAVVVVADACLGMYRNFCQHRITIAIAVLTASVLMIIPGIATQIAILILAAGLGIWQQSTLLPAQPEAQDTDKQDDAQPSPMTDKTPGSLWRSKPLWIFAFLLLVLPVIASGNAILDLFSRFYQAGSLVFGGGHVVLPLLQELVGDNMSQDRFLTGYAAAQAVPGPMFTLASFLGADLWADAPFSGALIATLGVFTPGLLLMYALQPHWEQLALRPGMAAAVTSINAAVVGLLLSALYAPVFSSAVFSGLDMALVIAGFWALKQLKLPLLAIVVLYVLAGTLLY